MLGMYSQDSQLVILVHVLDKVGGLLRQQCQQGRMGVCLFLRPCRVDDAALVYSERMIVSNNVVLYRTYLPSSKCKQLLRSCVIEF